MVIKYFRYNGLLPHSIRGICAVLVSFFFPSSFLEAQKSLFIGTIQFPSSLVTVPNIRVYYTGHTRTGEYDHDAKKVIFTIPEFKERSFFYLLISPEIEFCSRNTIPFLNLKPNASYKFYALQKVPVEVKNKRKRQESNQLEYTWIIKELVLTLPNGRIPDETIIVCYHPDYIQTVEGGNAIEFPKIMIKPDILTLVGSEAKLHQLSNRWFLAALNTDMIHACAPPEFIIKAQSKTVIAMAA